MASQQQKAVDFSKPAVARAVLKTTASHPMSIYPTVLAVLGALSAALFGPAELLIWGSSGALGLGLVSWLINYGMRRDSFASRYLERAHARLEEQTQARLETLKVELEELGLNQGVEQLAKFRDKLQNFKGLLERKLDPSELTYGRYLGIAEQVYLAAVDNLHEATLGLRAVSTVDLDYIDKRLRELERITSPKEEVAGEIKSLRERRELHGEQSKKVADLMSRNESAMTELDRTSAAIASIKTTPGHASMDFETAMSELALMANRAAKYSIK